MKNIFSAGFFLAFLVLAACEMPAGVDTDDSSSSSISVSSASSEATSVSTSESSSDTSSSDSSSSTTSASQSSSSAMSSSSGSSTTSSPSAKRTIDISVDNWVFSPSTVTAKKGEVLEIRLTGIAGTHGFAIPDLGINQTVAPGETITITIPTDKAGTFKFFCSIPCGSGHKDMTGTITIEE